MSCTDTATQEPAAIRGYPGAILVSVELSRKTWLVTSLAPGVTEKLSRHTIRAGQLGELLALLATLKAKAQGRADRIICIHEAGYDGFWLDRALKSEGIESHVVDPASVAVSRRKRRAKTDRLDGELLLRTLAAWLRGEPRVCSMAHPPSPLDEDRRQVTRERARLICDRIRHVNRIKGLLMAQGIGDFEPLRRGARAKVRTLITGDSRSLPEHLQRRLMRELDIIELLQAQIRLVEAERDALLAELAPAVAEPIVAEPAETDAAPAVTPAALTRLRGIGQQFAAVLVAEAFWRSFDNRRQLAAYAGLAATPYRSGEIDVELGISKAGNPRLRATLVQIAWLWLKHQPGSALSLWFHKRVKGAPLRVRKIMIVALARKLLIALWRFHTTGELPEGAALSPAT
jgi:transposase